MPGTLCLLVGGGCCVGWETPELQGGPGLELERAALFVAMKKPTL